MAIVWRSAYLHCNCLRVVRKIQRAGIRIQRHAIESTQGPGVLVTSRRRAKTSGKPGIHYCDGGGERKGSENARNSSQLSAGSPSAAIFRLRWLRWSGKPTRGKLARFATDRHASRNPTCFLSTLAFILSRTIFLPRPPAVPFPFLPFSTAVLVSPATRSLASLFQAARRHSFSRPLQTLWILQGGDTTGLSKFH